MCVLCMFFDDWESGGLKKPWGSNYSQETNNFFLGLRFHSGSSGSGSSLGGRCKVPLWKKWWL